MTEKSHRHDVVHVKDRAMLVTQFKRFVATATDVTSALRIKPANPITTTIRAPVSVI